MTVFANCIAGSPKLSVAERVDAYLDDGPGAPVAIETGDEEKIRQRIGVGNWILAREFGLDLGRYDYPMAADSDFSERQLAIAEQEIRFQTDIDTLRRSRSDIASDIRRSAEIVAMRSQLRELTAQFTTVSRSPVWRTVRRLETARRLLSRATSFALNLL